MRLSLTLPLLALTMASAQPSSLPPPQTPAARLVAQPHTLVIAHRGWSQIAPENTLPAFRLGLAARADLVELDYYHSRDGVPVVVHDTTLDRTTDAIARWGGKNLRVDAFDAATLTGLDAGTWFNPAFAGVPIPTLVEAIQTIQAGGVTLIERKAGDAPTLVQLLSDHDWLHTTVVQSFDWTFIRHARELAPNLVLGALGPPGSRDGRRLSDPERELSSGFIDEIHALGAQLVVWNRQVSAEAVANAQRRGLRVWVYTINDPDEAAHLESLGVNGIITDVPDLVRARLHPQPDEHPTPLPNRGIPDPLPDHPGNIHLEGATVRIRLPDPTPAEATHWRLLDDRHQTIRTGVLPSTHTPLEFPDLGVGWYRLELDSPAQTNLAFTTAAVLKRLAAPIPPDSPVSLDAAIAWFAPNEPAQQARFANLAALAGVNWVRDRLRWRDLQPTAGSWTPPPTTYDTAADIQTAAGLKILQVFHDTPPWARAHPAAGGRFAPDLRHLFAFTQSLANRFKNQVAAWEPWNEANVSTFGAHTVDEICSWQKAAWLGFKSVDPNLIVGWNVTTTVPTPAQTTGILLNEAWPFYDTYNIHTYDWSHSYSDLWAPARLATTGRPLWITEADRGSPHLGNPPWFDIDPRLEQLKAQWIAQSYASSLFAGARRHFHFILGHYHEPNRVQFGLLRLDLTPRPAYVALAAVGRCLAGAHILGRWQPGRHVHVYAFRAQPDGQPRDVLVVWAEQDLDWDGRGVTTADWTLPTHLTPSALVDYLGRDLAGTFPSPLTSRPVFVFLPPGQAATLPLQAPPPLPPSLPLDPSPVVLQTALPQSASVRVTDLPWSEGYAWRIAPGTSLEIPIHAYNFGQAPTLARLTLTDRPADWDVALPGKTLTLDPGQRGTFTLRLQTAPQPATRDAWITLHADCGPHGRPALAFRLLVKNPD